MSANIFTKISQKLKPLDSWADKLALAVCLLISIKLSLSYIFLIPLILWYLIRHFSISKILASELKPYFLPLFYLLILIIVSAPFGRSFNNSLAEAFKFFFLLLIIPCFFELSKKHNPFRFIAALAIGQSIAALHTVLQTGFPETFKRLFIGEVTEAGQLAISVPLLFGAALFLILINKEEEWLKSMTFHILRGSILIISLALFAFHTALNCSIESLSLISAIILGFIGWALITGFKTLHKNPVPVGLKLLCSTVLPIVIAGLVSNLKRGPWFGAFCAGILLILLYKRRLIPVVLFGAALAWWIDPIHQRILGSYNDFVIAGGRSEIWEIGAEMLLKYPIGIGYENSDLLRTFSQQIPPELTHFHSNPINIAVELGWVGLFLYLWWVFETCKPLFSNARTKISLGIAISAALLSLQLAGLVEYNFGDSEVIIIAYILVGLLPYSLRTTNSSMS
ncbi:MAG: O-antigen ligase family protein [Bdellovibrionota bacterium]